MRSLQNILIVFVTIFGCQSEPRQSQRYGSLIVPAKQPYCGERPIRLQGKMLAIPSRTQECSEHCWAAVLEMVSRYYGGNLRECDFAGIKLGDRNACCASDSCANQLCNQPVSKEEFTSMLAQNLGLKSRFEFRPLTEEELQSELSNGRPVIVGFEDGYRSHVALITGFILVPDLFTGTKAIYHLADPWRDIGLVQRTYDQINSGPSRDQPIPWSETWYRLSPREDGCNERFDPLCGCES